MTVALLLDLYELTMAQSYFIYKQNTSATFDLFVRSLPRRRAYLVACGLEDVVNFIRKIKFSADDIRYLKRQKLFSADFLKFLKHFRFKGDLWAMPEGEIFFANEPLIRVTASIIEAQILESFLLNTINLQTMIASKASRVVSAAGGRAVFDFALRRTHGSSAGIKVARSAYLAGFSGTSCVLAGKLFRIPIAGTMAHSFVMSFRNEIDSFLAYCSTFPDKSVLLVDTYDTKAGIRNALKVALYLQENGYRLQGIRLDSGDLVSLSRYARTVFDRAGLGYVKIFASGNLDEFKIKKLIKRGVRADNFGVGTNMGTSIDAPCLDVIYKLSEVTDESGKFLPAMKLSKGKVTYPGRKQVFRLADRQGRYLKDILGLEGEKIRGKPLLKKVISGGRIVRQLPSLEKARQYLKSNLAKLPAQLLEVDRVYGYPVKVSPQLKKLRSRLAGQLEDRQ